MTPRAHRHTLVVPHAHAFHEARYAAASERAVGRQIVTIEGLVARLAGPFLRAPDTGSVRAAVARSRHEDLGELAAIARLPGFIRAAAASLEAAWEQGIDPRRPPSAHPRWRALASLEAAVGAQLPPDVRLPRELAAIAAARAPFAASVLGPVTLRHLDDVAPCWRTVLGEIAERVDVVWHRLDDERPAWLPRRVLVQPEAPTPGPLERVACATPTHEVLEALRWARSLVAGGRAAPHEIAIAAASPAPYDAAMLAAARAALLPLHAVHGVPLTETAVGGRVAALADALVRTVGVERIRRLIDTLPDDAPEVAVLRRDDWWQGLRTAAPLTSPERWRRALGDRVRERPGAYLIGLIDALAEGPEHARRLGERLLAGEALTAWRRALDDGPARAIDATVARLRTSDGVDPLGAIAWGPAATLSLSPRPFVRLLGLSSRSWPRRPQDDPLLPEHVLGAPWPGPSLAELDRRSFARLVRYGRGTVVLSRARRDDDGRELVASPLLLTGAPAALSEERRSLRQVPEHALDEADRLAARPSEAAQDARVMAAGAAWRAWRHGALTPYDGLVRPAHPALVRAMARTHSATSLQRLLRDPQGFAWRYALGWEEPEERDDPFTLDPRAFGTLVHLVLERAVRHLERRHPGGFAAADGDAVAGAVDAVLGDALRETAEAAPVPPALARRRIAQTVGELALVALRHPFEPLPDARTLVEVAFGRHSAEPAGDAPWNPRESVPVGGAGLRIGGFIDRLELSGDGERARVVDYKTGRPHGITALRGLGGGKELQRCLYALAVRHFCGDRTTVEALLLYPRADRAVPLDDPDGAIDRLLSAIDTAHDAILRGRTLPGPDAFGPYNDLRFALPADALRDYRRIKEPLVAAELPPLADLWAAS